MDGVVYSTSQFGLDGLWIHILVVVFGHDIPVLIYVLLFPSERFGDGDASQIALDLDEVI